MRRTVTAVASQLRRGTVLPGRTGPAVALLVGRRGFYDKIRREREGSEESIDEFFSEMPKSPDAQRVPVELHKTNKEAVADAEVLNAVFLGVLVLLLGGITLFVDPFSNDEDMRHPRQLTERRARHFPTAASPKNSDEV